MFKKNKNFWAGTVIILAVIMGGIWFKNINYNQIRTDLAKQHPRVVRYQGEDGKDALSLLKQKAQIKTQTFEGMGELVTEINGVQPKPNQFWSYYVNNKPAQVGAGSFITHNSDVIEWRLETFKPTPKM